jgi:hypothetical protein
MQCSSRSRLPTKVVSPAPTTLHQRPTARGRCVGITHLIITPHSAVMQQSNFALHACTIIATLCTRTTTRHASATNQSPSPPSTGHAAATARWTFAFQHHRGPCRWASCGCADRRAVWDGVGVRRPGESHTASPSFSLRTCGAKASANATSTQTVEACRFTAKFVLLSVYE